MDKYLQRLPNLWKQMAADLFGEKFGGFRLFLLVLFISSWSGACVWIFETVGTFGEFIHQYVRYMIAPIGAFVLVFLAGGHYVQDLYEFDSFFAALRYLWACLFHSLLPRVKIAEGRIQTREGEQNLLAHVGGPGALDIERGNIVVLERFDSPSNILDAGHHLMSRYERIKNVISLLDQHSQPETPIIATTKDGITVQTHNLQVRCRVHTGYKHGEPKRTLRNPYPYSPKAVRDLTYQVKVDADGKSKPWQKIALGSVVGILTDFINSNVLDHVIYPRYDEKDSRNEVVKQIDSPKTRNKLKTQGVDLLWFDLGHFEVAKDIEQKRKDARFANIWGAASVIRAQGEAERIANHERRMI